MEVSSDGGTNWTKATATKLENLSAGSYKIRYAATDTKNASSACDVEVKASYKVTNFSNTKGSVSAANPYYEEGETVALTASATEGYFFKSVFYSDKNGVQAIAPDKGSYSFVMPASAVTLGAELSETQASSTIPNTGDASNLVMDALFMLAATGFIFASVAVYKKRREQ